MTKLEIQTAISSFLEKKPIFLKDILNATIRLNSYELFTQELTFITNSFEDIPEYKESAQEILSKMDNFIESCNFDDTTKLTAYIANYLHQRICGYSSSQISVLALSSISLNQTPETNISAIKQIYEELGYSNLKSYIELIKNPSNFTSYINSSDKQLVAMHFLLIRTNHHSNTKLKRNLTVEKLYQKTHDNISKSLSTITSQKDDFVSFMNNEKQRYETWYNETQEKAEQLYSKSNTEFQQFLDESKLSIEQLKKTYSDELKLKDPAQFMKDQSKHYKWSAICWCVATVVLTIALMYLLYLILDPHITFTKKIITITFFSNEMPIYSSVIIFSMIGLVIYIIRLFIKMAVSSKHLSEEYYQKYSLTYFYLSLLFDVN